MASKEIRFTKNAQDILRFMTSDTHQHFSDYLQNPIFTKFIEAGEPFQWWASTNHLAAWMEITCDKDAIIDLKAYELGRDAVVQEMPPNNIKMVAGLPKVASNLASLEFRRTQATLAKVAYAALGAARRDDFPLFSKMLGNLAKHVPWVEQITTLAHRMHTVDAGPRFLYVAMDQMSLIADLMDADLVRSTASPCTTAQALLAVHATLHHEDLVPKNGHNQTPPGLYALESPGRATTYLFVQPETLGETKPLPPGAHVWLDHTGAPIFLNEVKGTCDARFADMAHHPDPIMAAVQWMPEGPSKYGMLDTLTDWPTLMDQGFNTETRRLCDELAQATPRALNPQESLAVVQLWMNAPTSTQALWSNNVSKVHRTTLSFDTSNKSHVSLAMWGQYAAQVWAQQYPKEHAVLDTLLPKMDSLGAIEEWRQQMRAMSTPHTQATIEMYPLDQTTP